MEESGHMTVEPIRDKAKIKQMYQLLKGRDEKYALLFKFGLNTGLRNLFPSKKGGCIGRIQAYRVLKECAELLGIQNFGTHSLRKTWGYWTYKISLYNIGLIMDTFNHSSQSITLRYIGVNQDQKDELYSMVQL